MSIKGGFPAIVALLGIVACTDVAGPETQLTVRIDGPATVTSSAPSDEGVQCELKLTATARGAGHARWTAARFRWRDVETGALLGSSGWDASGVQSFWTAEGISAGTMLNSKAGATGGPHSFILDVEFEFVRDGSAAPDTALHTFTCVA